MISIAIIDDESKARETIINILGLSQTEIEIKGEADDIKSAYALIKKTSPDLVLLDIQLTDGTGFDLLRKFDHLKFRVIFITAHEEYAIQAFKFSAIDYILKPIVAGDLLNAVEKAKLSIQKEDTELKLSVLLDNLEKIKKIVLKTAESIHIVNIKNIIRCEADVNYTTFYLNNAEKLLVSKTLKEFEEMLGSSGFFRTHQSHLVNLDYILRYDKSEGGHLVMSDDSIVPVSSRKKDILFKVFETM
ncbi:MAG: LytTR family DNA-binding domain-containing protein [Bacteroidales bacterium]|nr:LytTR family DNA-binding domain-containing protein [Bacteroidales bacterium]MCF8403270.1 LytTR family DNA-binding domain-containing protein [Bacteroidales bacterium]